MDSIFLEYTHNLKAIGPEFLLIIGFLVCCIFILFSLRFFGVIGLVCYSVIAVIISNIQVLKLGTFNLTNEPVALGTIVFTSIFVASDIITEHYDPSVARRAVFLGFIMQIFLMLSMVTVIAHPESTIHSPSLVQRSLETIFAPSFRILVASICSFLISQYIDISIFSYLKKRHGRNLLWLRSNASTLISGFCDTVIFSLLAWIVFSPDPLSINTVMIGFIGFSQATRVIVSIISTPLLYLSYRLKPREL